MFFGPTQPSPLLKSHIDAALWEVWPALAPRFSHVAGPYRYLPPSVQTLSQDRAAGRVRATEGLAALETVRPSAAAAPWHLTLLRAAAYLKLGDPKQARAILSALTFNPHLRQSLAAQPVPAAAPLMQAHPLYNVMHVAIEQGCGASFWPLLASLGLTERCSCEPEQASMLLVNAVKQGDACALRAMLLEGLRLSDKARARLEQDSFEIMRLLRQDHRVSQTTDEALVDGLALLQACMRQAGLSTEAFEPILFADRPLSKARLLGRWCKTFAPKANRPLVLVVPVAKRQRNASS